MSDEDTRQTHQRNREQYAGVADRYATSASHATGDDLAWFAARAMSVVPGIAVDVACGGGFATRALLDAGHRVVATDLTPESVMAARGSTHSGRALGWVAAAAEALPFRAGAVPLVSCRIAPHHFADPARFVDEVTRVLAPGGLFLLVDTTVPEDDALAAWIDDVERRRDPSHVRAWPPSRWRAVLTGAGLAVDELRTFRKRHELDPWLARSATPDDVAADVRGRFAAATPEQRAAFVIEKDGDAVAAYTDTKVCIASRRV